MKKLFAFTIPAFLLLSNANAQCPADTVQTLYHIDWMGDSAYIDQLVVDGNTISTASGVQQYTASYQRFNTPLIYFEQGMTHFFEVSGVESYSYSVGVWVDIDEDGLYSGSEMLGFGHSSSANGYMSLSISLPFDIYADTINVRIIKFTDRNNTGFPGGDACSFSFSDGGEVEDYRALVHCASFNPYVSYDQFPVICTGYGEFLNANSPFGNIYWYSDTTLAPVDSGYTIQISDPPGLSTYYITNPVGGCRGSFFQIDANILPSPIVDISTTDTIYSCSPIILDAGNSGMSYYWNTGEMSQTILVSSFLGYINVQVTDPNGCYTTDQVWVSVIADAPGNHAFFAAGSTFCSTFDGALVYDSVFVPGTVNWYETSTGNLLGSGSVFPITLPGIGTYQFTAVINSMCGADTTTITVNANGPPVADSIYVVGAHHIAADTVIFCNTGNTVTFAVALSNGSVDQWDGYDYTLGFGFSMPGNGNSLDVNTSLFQQGDLYYVVAHLIDQYGCTGITDTLWGYPSTPSGINLMDTTWRCTFPTTLGTNVNYSVFDVLWSNGDTTGVITVNSPSSYTVTVNDATNGCTSTMSTYVANGSLPNDLLPPTTVICNPDYYFDAVPTAYNVMQWDEYDLLWNMINSYNTSDVLIPNPGQSEYLVVTYQNPHGCFGTDTTYLDFNGTFTFTLGPDINTAASTYTITAPYSPGYIYMWTPSISTGATATVSTSGSYALTIDNGQGCFYTDAIVVTFINGIEEHTVNSFSMFPNPAHGSFTIQSDRDIVQLRMTDTRGRSVVSIEGEHQTKMEMNTTELTPGIYFVEVTTENGRSVKKIVIY